MLLLPLPPLPPLLPVAMADTCGAATPKMLVLRPPGQKMTWKPAPTGMTKVESWSSKAEHWHVSNSKRF